MFDLSSGILCMLLSGVTITGGFGLLRTFYKCQVFFAMVKLFNYAIPTH